MLLAQAIVHLERNDREGLARYLAAITTDERLMAIVICDDGTNALVSTGRTPKEIGCGILRDIGERGSSILKLRDGSVEAVFAGPAAEVEAAIEACRRGPFSARVTALDQREGSEVDLAERSGDFSVLPTV